MLRFSLDNSVDFEMWVGMIILLYLINLLVMSETNRRSTDEIQVDPYGDNKEAREFGTLTRRGLVRSQWRELEDRELNFFNKIYFKLLKKILNKNKL